MKIETKRHSLSHILALAVKEIYQDVLFGIGPPTETGFYYDFDFKGKKIQEEDLKKIEKKMKEIILRDLKFEKEKLKISEAKKLFKNQPYKLELLKENLKKEKKVTIYKLGDFIDLCKGPHIKSTKEIDPQSFKLTKIAGAYWKGSEKNPQLTRIYGVAFDTKEELKKFLKLQQEKEKRDHRVLGKKLKLFIFDEEIGAGLPLWLPKGELLRHLIENYLYEKLSKNGYLWVRTPHIGKIDLWKRSGHWDFYRENIYSPIEIEKEKYILKPMNCPFHIKIYQSEIRSYKNLPLKLAELGTVYRYERSGVLHGLTRVRGFTQDDAHIFCTKDQLSKELEKLLKEGLEILKGFGFKEYEIYLSKRPKKYVGELKMWQKAEKTLKFILEKLSLKYEIDPEGGVFYGPKIDLKIKDALGRPWQLSTFQIDFNLPERFNLFFINKKGKKERPILIHRALLGSIERFIGILLENFEGRLPLWLSPIQMWIIPVGSAHKKYARKIYKELKKENFRVEIKEEKETVSKKIREGEIQKIPYILVVGDKEMKNNSVRVRSKNKDLGETNLKNFIKKIKIEIEKKKRSS